MEVILIFAFGILVGLVGGLIPGLHSNTIIPIIASFGLDPQAMAILIIALFPAHMIASLIPAIFFGIPDNQNVVAVLPGQRMVLEGHGIDALKVALISMLFSALIVFAVFFVSMDFYQISYTAIRENMKYILLAFSILLLLTSKKPHLSIIIFLAAGILGKFAFNLQIQDPFLPLFSGLFALAAILTYQKGRVPKQEEHPLKFDFLKYVTLGTLLGLVADLLPGIGSSTQIATLAAIFIPFGTLNFLATTSSISVSQAMFSLSTSAAIDKTRVGATAWLDNFIIIKENLVFLLALFVISLAISALIIYLLRKRAGKLASIDFLKMNVVLGVYLAAITYVIDGPWGLIVLILAAGLGWATIKLGVERTTLMGAIIIPTLLLLFRVFI